MNLIQVNARIVELSSDLSAESIRYQGFKDKINTCNNKSLGCKRKTGKPINTWRGYRDRSDATMKVIEAELNRMTKLKADLLQGVKTQAQAEEEMAAADIVQANADLADSDASAGSAKAIGLWVGVGLAAIAGGALIWFKIIKKK